MAEINLKTLTTGGGVYEIDVNFNGTLEGQADATIPLNVNLTDSLGDVTPTSVLLTGNDLDIVIPDAAAPSGVLFQTIEPSQYTSYRTGDEGDRVQTGWFDYTPPSNPAAVAKLDYSSANYHFVLNSPLVVGGVSSTARFVDANGVQVFSIVNNANTVLIDKLTGMMYSRVLSSQISWNFQIDNALSYSITVNGQLYDDWFLASSNEFLSIVNQQSIWALLPDTNTSVNLMTNFVSANNFIFSNTKRTATANALSSLISSEGITTINKTNSTPYGLRIRNARNLITAP